MPLLSTFAAASVRGLRAAAAAFVPPSTSYVTGDRTGSITVTSNITWDAGTNDNLVDGSMTSSSAGSVDTPGTGSTAIADGAYIRFDYGGSPKYVDEAKIYTASTPTNGAWKWQASNDASSWVDVSSNFTWDAATETVSLSLTAGYYRYYQMVKVGAGTNWANDWFREVEFKQSA